MSKDKEPLTVGKQYVIDEDFNSSGTVVLLELYGDHYCLVCDEEGSWRTMQSRLSPIPTP